MAKVVENAAFYGYSFNMNSQENTVSALIKYTFMTTKLQLYLVYNTLTEVIKKRTTKLK
jgi:hypothetical protein